MSDRIIYSRAAYENAAEQIKAVERELSSIMSGLGSINTSGEWWDKLRIGASVGTGSARMTLSRIQGEGHKLQRELENTISGIKRACNSFEAADKAAGRDTHGGNGADVFTKAGIAGVAAGVAAANEAKESFIRRFMKAFDEWKLPGVLGLPGKLYNLIRDGFKAEYWSQWAKLTVDGIDFLAKVGKCVKVARDAKATTTWWQEAFDIKKRSNPLGNLSGANGAFKATVSWLGVALDGVTNYYNNKKEQAASGGKMSNGRVVAETWLETSTNLSLKIGVGMVAAAACPATWPALAVGIVSTVGVEAINAGCKALTGKSAAEWTADFVLDTVVPNVGKAAQKTVKFVSDTGKAVVDKAAEVGKTAHKIVKNARESFSNATKWMGGILAWN